jgi:hypothetical protein
MKAQRKSIGQNGIGGRRGQSGIGYVALPDDEERSAFITRCLRSGTVTIRTENTELIRDVQIGQLALQLIEFPATSKELGSCVGWTKIPRHEKPIIFDVFTKYDEVNPLTEGEFLLSKTSAGGMVSLSGQAANGVLAVHVEGAAASGGELHVTVRNQNKTGKLRVQVQGTAEVHVEGSAKVTATESITTEAVSGQDAGRTVHTPQQITSTAQKLVAGTGKEPVALAQSLKEFLDKFVGLVSKSTVSTMLGTQPLLNAAQIAELQSETEAIKSQLSFTD